VSSTALHEQVSTLEAQHPARAALHTLAARQTIRILDIFSQPDVPAHVNADRAVKRTYPALHAVGWIRDHMIGCQIFVPVGLVTGGLSSHKPGNIIHHQFSGIQEEKHGTLPPRGTDRFFGPFLSGDLLCI
jgi:hypothetical protein